MSEKSSEVATSHSTFLRWLPALMGLVFGGSGGGYTVVSVEQIKADLDSLEAETRAHKDAHGHPIALMRVERAEADAVRTRIEAKENARRMDAKLDHMMETLSALCTANPRAKCHRHR